MIYLYGLLEPDAAVSTATLKTLDGVTGAVHVSDIPIGHLVYGSHDGSDILPKRRALLRHAKVLESLLDMGTILPMRFGLVAESTNAFSAILAAQSEQLAREFARLQGCVEFGVKVEFEEASALRHQLSLHPGLTGEHRRLLESRRSNQFDSAEFGRRLGEALERRRTDAQHALVKALAPHVRDIIVRAPERVAQVLSADVLVGPEEMDHFEQRLQSLVVSLNFMPGPSPLISLVGPEPVYNFVRINLSTSERQAA